MRTLWPPCPVPGVLPGSQASVHCGSAFPVSKCWAPEGPGLQPASPCCRGAAQLGTWPSAPIARLGPDVKKVGSFSFWEQSPSHCGMLSKNNYFWREGRA